MKRFAFTLAEVMIALGIVGVIAVLTLPNLMSGTNEKTRAVALKVTYEQLSNAVKGAMLDENVHYWTDSQYGNNKDDIEEFFKKYLDVAKLCDPVTDCFASGYKTISGSSKDISLAYKVAAKLSSGASVAMYTPSDSARGSFLVDVNGKDAPNIFGKDLFVIDIGLRGDVGTTEDSTYDEATRKEACVKATYESSCFDYVRANNWSMDY